jgi:hypothetical protein
MRLILPPPSKSGTSRVARSIMLPAALPDAVTTTAPIAHQEPLGLDRGRKACLVGGLPLTMTRAWNPGMTCQGCKPSTHTPLDERGLIKCPLCSALRTQVGHFAKTAKCPTAPLTLARDVPIATSYAPYESSWGGTSRPGPPPREPAAIDNWVVRLIRCRCPKDRK